MEFAKSTPAPTPKTPNIRAIGILTAALFILLAVAQLFTFERFGEVLTLYYAGLLDDSASRVAAACITILEVAAIPFFLAMPMSKAARIISMIAGWLTVLIWGIFAVYSLGGGYTALLGAVVELSAGWWQLCFLIAVGVLVAWTSWGMWPFSRQR